MNTRRPNDVLRLLWWAVLACALSGCRVLLPPGAAPPTTPPPEPPPTAEAPRELAKVSLPPYVIEPPDILLIDAIKVVPKPPYHVEPLDILAIRVEGALLDEPIAGTYAVDPDGTVELGPSYGRVSVVDMTIDEARTAIDKHLQQILNEPVVSISLAAAAGQQQIAGQHLVGPDGAVNLGTYGSVYIAGLTLPQAKAAIEGQLGRHLLNPEVTVDVFAYNSKVYYIITEGAGFGDNVVRRPVTGNETVLDAISTIGGLSQISSKRLWISRPAPNGVGCEQVLPIHWVEITRGASTATNYQLLPGDRLFIAEDKMTAFDSLVSKLTRPFERIFGFNLLGTQMISRFNQLPQGNNNF
jgi:protein involved in polysaccharide export with SLBB domain